MAVVREPVVAGQFYPGSTGMLEAQIAGFVNVAAPKEDVVGLVSPHAGYMYYGPVAGATISRVRFRDTFVIMGPNHTGMGQRYSIMTQGSWRTPMGEAEIDSELASRILANSSHLKEDEMAHLQEHSIEVQIPFLQYFKRDVRIVPIVLAPADPAAYKEIGHAIATAIRDLNREAVIMASSDMTHYEPQESANRKDRQAIEAMLELDEDELLRRVGELRITMCGYALAVSLLSACKELGAAKAELVMYQTSGDVIGDYRSVVGYAGIILTRG